MSVTFVDNGEYLRWTVYDTEALANGYLWDPERGWCTWEDRGDRVVRAKPCAEARVPEQFREQLARRKAAS